MSNKDNENEMKSSLNRYNGQAQRPLPPVLCIEYNPQFRLSPLRLYFARFPATLNQAVVREKSGADPGFPIEGSPTLQGTLTYNFCQDFKKKTA